MAVNGTMLIIKRDDTDAEEYLNPNVINICPTKPTAHMVSKPIKVGPFNDKSAELAGISMMRLDNRYVQNTTVTVLY